MFVHQSPLLHSTLPEVVSEYYIQVHNIHSIYYVCYILLVFDL